MLILYLVMRHDGGGCHLLGGGMATRLRGGSSYIAFPYFRWQPFPLFSARRVNKVLTLFSLFVGPVFDYPVCAARHAPRRTRDLPRHTSLKASHDVQRDAGQRHPRHLQKVHGKCTLIVCISPAQALLKANATALGDLCRR